jgi:hypothetical protein
MRLFEFAQDDPLRVKLSVVASKLKSNSEYAKTPITTQDFVAMLQKQGLPIEESDIYDLIKKEPLSNIIDSIEQGHVIFKGQQKPAGGASNQQGPDQNEKTIKAMAKKQIGKTPSPMGL